MHVVDITSHASKGEKHYTHTFSLGDWLQSNNSFEIRSAISASYEFRHRRIAMWCVGKACLETPDPIPLEEAGDEVHVHGACDGDVAEQRKRAR